MAGLIELRHLRYFAAVASRMHFTQAAADLGIAQPALSQQIRQLESLLGVLLFERTNRSVRLTPAGNVLLTHANTVLAELARAEAAMRDYAEQVRGNLAIGALPLLGELLFPPLMSEFAAAYPAVTMSFREDQNERLVEAVRAGDLQAALIDTTALGPESLAGVEIKNLFHAPMIVAMATSHPLASRSSVELADLRGERFIQFSAGSNVRHRRSQALAQDIALDITPSFVVTQSSLVRALVADGSGIAFGPQWLKHLPGTAISAPTLSDEHVGFTVALAWRSEDETPLIALFLALLERTIAATSLA